MRRWILVGAEMHNPLFSRSNQLSNQLSNKLCNQLFAYQLPCRHQGSGSSGSPGAKKNISNADVFGESDRLQSN